MLGVAVLGGACLFSATGWGDDVDGVPSTAFLAGAPTHDDPDALVHTGRWAENLETPPLAGGPPISPPIETLAAATPSPQPSIERRALASTPPGDLRRAAFQPTRPAPTARLEMRTDAEAIPALPLAAPPAERGFDARRLLLRIGPPPQDRGKGRWFVFAAGSGEAFGLNLIRDPIQGWRRGGWSVERLAEYGKAQVGLGWRQGDRQVALSVARRETGAYGISREDTVVGVNFTISGQPPQKVRFEQRLPRR
ncbi:hypothetical protein [Caulobacter mirabilis]|uniref:Uncharacterized protein n=1 Tax=Caulobacter mirabilis TaxID=69666 RepID=A0A2D2AWG1_9CAUL|nr:hypothetical protein [Caulobacter mirabilis]ATQ42352.1 hypothetical protein CSW64_07960 [Caulobacter mirabilis]